MANVIDRRNKSMGGGDKRSVSNIQNIAIHYSATAQGNTASFENFWKNTHGWNTGGYHEVVLLNGDVELNYNADTISNGVGGQNTRMYNICYVGAGVPNAAQLKTLEKRANYNRNRFGLSANAVRGHREFSGQSTSCPGLNMGNFRKSLDGASTVKPSKPKVKPSTTEKSISEMASEVIAGKHGSGHTNRRQSLGISQSEYEKVRAEVNRRSGISTPAPSKPKGKSIAQMATEVMNGNHGSGHANRRKSLGISQAQYERVRTEVNKRAGSGGGTSSSKSVSQMATEVIRGNHGTGHAARRKSLGISQAQYNKVRAEVNKRL